jgi:hypothetical protein
MKRIILKHGTARVEDNCSNETIEAINKLSELVFNGDCCSSCKKLLSEIDLKFGKKSKPVLCVTCYTSNS